eukprot:4882588-Pleurochrysis_carterae.AAC.6
MRGHVWGAGGAQVEGWVGEGGGSGTSKEKEVNKQRRRYWKGGREGETEGTMRATSAVHRSSRRAESRRARVCGWDRRRPAVKNASYKCARSM